MKFLLATAAYLVIALFLGWGILLAVTGSYWLLAFTTLVYLLAFAWYGCLPPKTHH